MINLIKRYYEQRGLKWPTSVEALMWAQTEMAEVYELLLARAGGWTRNNPNDHGEFDLEKFAEELGDVIMMVIVAGIVEGVNPLTAMLNKMGRKLLEISVVRDILQVVADIDGGPNPPTQSEKQFDPGEPQHIRTIAR